MSLLMQLESDLKNRQQILAQDVPGTDPPGLDPDTETPDTTPPPDSDDV